MSPSNEQILIDYLDNILDGEDRQQAEKLIGDDAAAAKELADLQFSVELVREVGVLEQVQEVRNSFAAGAKLVPMQKKENGAVVRSFSRNVFRVAAMVVVILGAASVYKYSNTTTASIFNENYASYELTSSRGTNNDGDLETAYRNKNWTGAETAFSQLTAKTAKSWFLAGMASMELKKYDQATAYFKEVIKINSNSSEPVYQDEAEYYQAMSWLAAQHPAEGLAILKKIRSDKDHLFYKKANAINALDLKVLDIKY